MKKILFLFAILFATLTSCSTDDNSTTPQTASLEKTSVSVITMADSQTSSTSKNIARGNIYAWVNTITLNASNTSTGYASLPANVRNISDTFTLTGNYNANVTTAFGLDNLLVGPTTFTATSTTDSAKRLTLAPASGNASTVLTGLRANNPYVVYNSGNVTANLTSGGTNIVSIPMTTQQGRMLSVFQMDSDTAFRAKYSATINVTAEGETIVPSQNVPISGNGLVTLEWSSDKSINGKKLTYTITVAPINANMYPGETPSTYTIVETITASTSYSCIYTIDKNKAPKTNVDVDNIKFTWQQWLETGCPTGDCN